MMGTVAEGDDEISILEAGARLENDTQPLLMDQSMCNNGEEDSDGLQNASYFALKKAFAALKVRLREVEHENERLHRQVKQLESGSGDFSGSGTPRPELMPSINKAYEAYKEKCHESSQLKEQLTKVTQKWQTAEGQLEQLREQLSRGCTKCAVQQTAGSSEGTAEGQTAQRCSKCNAQYYSKCDLQGTAESCSRCDPLGTAESCSRCSNHETAPSCSKCAAREGEQSCSDRLKELTQHQMESFSKPPDHVPRLSAPGGSAPASLASVLQEEMDQTRAEMVQLRSLVRTQHLALNRLLSLQPQAPSPEPASVGREGPPTPGDSDIGSLGVLEGAELASYPPPDSADPTVRGHDIADLRVGGHDFADPMVGGHGVHPVQCTDEFSRRNVPANRNGESEDLMLFSGSTLASRLTNQFGRTANPAGVSTGNIARPQYPDSTGPRPQYPNGMTTGNNARPRYPPADGYHCIVGIPLPTGRPERPPQGATLENRFRQLGANQSVQTPIRYERNTEYVSRHDNVGSNVNIAQPEPTDTNQSSTPPMTQTRQFAWLESGKEIPPQNIYTTQNSSQPAHDLQPQVRGHGEVRGQSGEWGNEVIVQGSALEWDRECPMCQQVFPDDILQEVFVQHVNAHFEEEETRDDGFELFQM